MTDKRFEDAYDRDERRRIREADRAAAVSALNAESNIVLKLRRTIKATLQAAGANPSDHYCTEMTRGLLTLTLNTKYKEHLVYTTMGARVRRKRDIELKVMSRTEIQRRYFPAEYKKLRAVEGETGASVIVVRSPLIKGRSLALCKYFTQAPTETQDDNGVIHERAPARDNLLLFYNLLVAAGDYRSIAARRRRELKQRSYQLHRKELEYHDAVDYIQLIRTAADCRAWVKRIERGETV